MNTSDEIDEITKALCNARPGFGEIIRNCEVKVKMKNGGEYTFKYAPYPEIIDKTEQALNANGLYIVQSDHDGKMVSRLFHTSGQWIENSVGVEYGGKNAQEYGAALTYSRRYGYMQLLGLCPEDDNENRLGDADSETVQNNRFPPKDSRDENWQGPLTKTELRDHCKDYAEQFSCAPTMDALEVIKNSPEFRKFVEQSRHDYPGLIDGEKFWGEFQPGLMQDYNQRKKELLQLAEMEPRK